MNKKIDQNFSEIFNIDPLIAETPEPELEVEEVEPEETPSQELVITEQPTVQDDSEYARKNLRDLIDKGNKAMAHLLQVAKEAESARAYEVVGSLMKSLADLNKDLIDVHKKEQDLVPKNPATTPASGDVRIDKAIFVGTTVELLDLYNKQKKEALDGNSN